MLTKLFISCSVLVVLFQAAVKPLEAAKIDVYKITIDNKLKTNKLVRKWYNDSTIKGVNLYGYYDKGKLVLIKEFLDSPIGLWYADYYVNNDTLVYVFEKIRYVKADKPEDFATYKKKYPGKNGREIDFDKAPQATNNDNIFYIKDMRPFHSIYKDFGKTYKPTAEQMKIKANRIKNMYKQHLENLAKVK